MNPMDLSWRLLKLSTSFRGSIMEHLPTELNYNQLQEHLENNPNSTLGDLVTPYLTGQLTNPTSEVEYNPPSYQDEELPYPLSQEHSENFMNTFQDDDGNYSIPDSYYGSMRSKDDTHNQKLLSNVMRTLHGRIRQANEGFEMNAPRTEGTYVDAERGRELPKGRMARHNMRLQDYMNTPVKIREAQMTPLISEESEMIHASEPMDIAMRLLKRQTELGEHPGFEEEAFSSHGPVTHYHATKLPENAESIKRHGIWPAGNYATHSGGKTKSIYSNLVNNMKLENTEPLIWATGEGQELPTEYAGAYDDKWVGEPQFDESGMLIPGTGPSREREFQEGGMFGIRGSNIDWKRSPSPIYRQGEEFYIHNQPIPREQIIPMPVQTGEPMDLAWRLLKMPPTWYFDSDPQPPKNEDFTMLQDASLHHDLPEAHIFSQVWESDDGVARGVAYPDHNEGTWAISHFEIADNLQGLGLGQEYLERYIDELRESEYPDEGNFHNNEPYDVHVTHVDPTAMGFWDKMVDRGLLHGAHETAWIRENPEGTHYYTHAYNSNKLVAKSTQSLYDYPTSARLMEPFAKSYFIMKSEDFVDALSKML